jgi:hypothetical protein
MHASHVVAAIGAVLDHMVDALVGQDAGDEHILDADIAEQIVEVGGVERRRGGLGQHDLIFLRRNLVDHARLP